MVTQQQITSAKIIIYQYYEKMADLLGENPNLIDDIFRDLENWEAILQTMPDFDEDETPDERQEYPSIDLTPDI